MKEIARSTPLLLGVVLALALTGAAFAAGNSAVPTKEKDEAEESELSPDERARQRFNVGISMRDRAWKLEKELADAADDGERAKLQKKIDRAFRSAAREFEAAAELKPDFHQAYSSLGYALRRMGDYEQSLEAYDSALALAPDYAEAIEYRGQAYLGLGRLDDAQKAYVRLFDLDRALAAELMAAMKAWVQESAADSGVDADRLGRFKQWLNEREQLAAQNASLRGGGAGATW